MDEIMGGIIVAIVFAPASTIGLVLSALQISQFFMLLRNRMRTRAWSLAVWLCTTSPVMYPRSWSYFKL